MPHRDSLIVIGLGVLFILLGLALLIWGKKEEKNYYNALTGRHDVREFMEHWPIRIEPGALKLGGWITIAIGILMAILGGAFMLWG